MLKRQNIEIYFIILYYQGDFLTTNPQASYKSILIRFGYIYEALILLVHQEYQVNEVNHNRCFCELQKGEITVLSRKVFH